MCNSGAAWAYDTEWHDGGSCTVLYGDGRILTHHKDGSITEHPKVAPQTLQLPPNYKKHSRTNYFQPIFNFQGDCATLDQRIEELERQNAELLAQLEAMQGGK